MEAASTSPPVRGFALGRRRIRDRFGDVGLYLITALAAAAGVALLVAIAWKVIDGTRLAFSTYGLGFLTSSDWVPNGAHQVYGALPLIYGTAVSSLIALIIAVPLAIAIGLYLSELAPSGIRWLVSSLVEMLAAIPSVVLGLWGILVLGPFCQDHLEPWLKDVLGFLPIFSGEPSNFGMLPAGLILAIMVLPIVASISRELFLAVPQELEEGALALGTTRWEMVRGVILPSARSGVAAAVILGLGRALGEAIAVTQVIGNTTGHQAISRSLFATSDTLASRIANLFQGATGPLQTSALFYLATILLVFELIVNVIAQLIVRRFDRLRGAMA
jgi:phosphate transport system permease protein